MEVKKRIHSPALAGIVKDDAHHRQAATLTSTGDLVLVFHGEDDPRNWCMEFKSDINGDIVQQWHADLHERMLAALKEAGIIQA